MSLQPSESKAPADVAPAPDTVTTGPIQGSRKIYARAGVPPPPPRAVPRDRPLRPEATGRPGLRPLRPLHRRGGPHRPAPGPAGCPRGLDRRPRLRAGRGPRPSPGGQRGPARGPGRRGLPGPPHPARRAPRPEGHPIRVRPRRHRHGGDGLRRPSREPRARIGAGRGGRPPPRRRQLRRVPPRVRDARVRPERDRAGPRHHPGEHQPSRGRAHGDRAQLLREGQRQHRQLGRDVGRRRGGRETGVGDPLGRRHRHGPVDGPQHPQHPLLDHPQLAGADRHGADLSGAGEGRRRPRQARLGGVQGHADRAGRAGRRLLHPSTPAYGCTTSR